MEAVSLCKFMPPLGQKGRTTKAVLWGFTWVSKPQSSLLSADGIQAPFPRFLRTVSPGSQRLSEPAAMDPSGLKNGAHPLTIQFLLQCSRCSTQPVSTGTHPKLAEQMSGKGATRWTMHKRLGCSKDGVCMQYKTPSPQGGETLTAEWGQAQVQTLKRSSD